jgi:RAD50-interacting protein 1
VCHSNECLALLEQGSATGALHPYLQLHQLLRSLGPLQEAAEGAAPHLVDHVARTVQDVHSRIQESLSNDFQTVLDQVSWPKKDAAVPVGLQDDWARRVGQLLELQKPDLDAHEKDCVNNKTLRTPKVLLPLQVMVKPLEMAFRYHFEGDKRTNRPEKPELFLDHIQKLLNAHYDFILDYLQPVLLQHFRGTSLASNSIYIDATSAFITAVLPMVRTKVFALVPEVASQPQLLSHLMHELKSFDDSIRNEWKYDGGYGAEGWKGLAWEVLVQKDWFGRWLQVEKDCKWHLPLEGNEPSHWSRVY